LKKNTIVKKFDKFESLVSLKNDLQNKLDDAFKNNKFNELECIKSELDEVTKELNKSQPTIDKLKIYNIKNFENTIPTPYGLAIYFESISVEIPEKDARYYVGTFTAEVKLEKQ